MRLPDWPARLANELKAADERPFSSLGPCLTFAASCVFAMTGVDYAARFRLASAEDERAILDAHGGVEGVLTAVLGHPVETLRIGDVVTADFDAGITAGICLGRYCAFRSADGLRYSRRDVIRNVWRVD